MRVALCLLCVRPNESQATFYSGFADEGIDVFVLADCNQHIYSVPQASMLLQVPDRHCIGQGYHHFNTTIKAKRICSAWDKALFFFCKRLTGYDQVWFLEEDVFVPSISSLLMVHNSSQCEDLVSCQKSRVISSCNGISNSKWAHWNKLPKILNSPPFINSMVCISRLSRDLLNCIAEFTVRYNECNRTGIAWDDVDLVTAEIGVPFIEFTLPMLALQNGLTQISPPAFQVEATNKKLGLEISSDYDSRALKSICQMISPDNIYHPIKDILLQDRLRSRLFHI